MINARRGTAGRGLTRRRFLAAGAAGMGASLFAAGAKGAARPNIVWLIADDMSPDLGCYGNELVTTPNLDRLASEGVRFGRAFTTAAVCSPSRSAWIAGMYQTSIGAHHHRTWTKQPLPGEVRPFTHVLRDAGYKTVNLEALGANGKTDFNFVTADPVFESNSLDLDNPRQPFFAYVNFHEPHRQFVQAENGVDPDRVELPPYYPDHPVARKDWAMYLDSVNELDRKVGRFMRWMEDAGLLDNTVVIFVGDHGRPHVRGKQWLYDGGIRVPLIVRLPGGVYAGSASGRLVSSIDLAAQTLAFAGAGIPEWMQGRPFMGAAAEPREYVFAARDRCDEAFDRIRCVRDKRFKYIRNFYPEIPYWQTSRYKDKNYPMLDLLKRLHSEGRLTPVQERFFAPSKPPVELYDTESDPHEIENLAGRPEYRDVVERMGAALDRWEEETGDMGREPEPLSVWDAIMENRRRKYPRFEPDEWDRRFEAIRRGLVEREYRPMPAD